MTTYTPQEIAIRRKCMQQMVRKCMELHDKAPDSAMVVLLQIELMLYRSIALEAGFDPLSGSAEICADRS